MLGIVQLGQNVQAQADYFAPLAVGSTVYRTIYTLYPVNQSGMLKHYEIWLSQEYVEDSLNLSTGATKEQIQAFADRYLKKRFEDSENHIPDEDGAFLTNELGECLGNPRTFELKLKDSIKPKYVTTNIRLPENTHKWLKEQGEKYNIGLGEAIRRVVNETAAGTAISRSDPGQSKIDVIGKPTDK